MTTKTKIIAAVAIVAAVASIAWYIKSKKEKDALKNTGGIKPLTNAGARRRSLCVERGAKSTLTPDGKYEVCEGKTSTVVYNTQTGDKL
jgi:hypothetical protein